MSAIRKGVTGVELWPIVFTSLRKAQAGVAQLGSMPRFLLERLAMMPLIALGVITVLFIIFKSVPGDEASMAAGAMANQAEIEAMRRSLVSTGRSSSSISAISSGSCAGDFGYSSTFRGNPLWPILERLPATLLLMASAITMTVVVGVPAGVIAGANQGRWPDLLLSGSS